MARLPFSTDPLSLQLDAETRAARGRGLVLPGDEAKPQQQSSGQQTKAEIDRIAQETRVPANVLMALAERDGAQDGSSAIAAATKHAQALAGKDLQAALDAQFGADTAGRDGLLDRADAIGRALYADAQTTVTLKKDKGRGALGVLSDVNTAAAATGGRIGAGIVSALGTAANEAPSLLPAQPVRDPATGKVTGLDDDRGADGTMLGRGLTAAADWLSKRADAKGEQMSDAAKAAQKGMIDGDADLFKGENPIGDDPSFEGALYAAMDVFGSMAPVVLTAIAMRGRSAAAPAAVGGVIGGGSAGLDAVKKIDQMAQEVGPDGRSRLEKESKVYQAAIAGGMSPADALKHTREEARTFATMLTAPVSAAGGAATGNLLTQPLKALAGRSLPAQVLGRGALSATEEAAQEVAEGVAQNVGMNVGAGTAESVTEGSAANALLGAVGGGVPGAIAGGFDLDRPADQPGPLPPERGLPAPDANGAYPFTTAPMPGAPTPVAPEAEILPPPERPKGRLELALEKAMPAEPPAPIFAGTPGQVIDVTDASTGETFTGTFVGESPDGVTLTIAGSDFTVLRADLESGMFGITAAEAPALPDAAAIEADDDADSTLRAHDDDGGRGAGTVPGGDADTGRGAEPDPLAGPPADSAEGAGDERLPALETGAGADEGVDGDAAPGDVDIPVAETRQDGKENPGQTTEPAASPKPTPEYAQNYSDPIPAPADPVEAAVRAAVQAGEVQHTTGKGKLLTGYVAQDMTPGAAKAIDPYAFKKNGGWFIRKAAAEKARAEWPNETRDEPQLAMSDPQLPAPAPGSVAAAATDAAPAPTDAQKQAGNYAKGHSRWQGLALSIENQKGSERSGTGRDGNPWSVTMPAHYGYFKGTEGADGDHVDFYMGDDEASDFVLVVDQKDADTGAFDEHKVILGTRDAAEALTTYKAGFSDGRGADRIGGVREFSRDEFKDWLANGDTRKPASPQFEGQNRPASNPDQITKPQQTLVKAALEPAVDPIPIKKPEAAPASGPQKSGPGFLKVLNAAKGAKAKHRLRAEATADYLAPGNVVPSYGGGHDIVLAYDAEARSIRVQPAIRQGDGWVSDPSQPARTHATLPEDRALATGPVYRDAAKIEAPAAAPETGITRRPVKADKAITARGRELAVEYSVVELDDLMPSQMDDGRDNPDFPQELQPRDRSGNKSQEQVRKIAQDLRPGLLGENPQASAGAPIVTKDGTVISGNGRTLALRRAHAEGAAGRYREWLAHKGYPVDGMRQPVLVRVLTDDMDTDALAATAREANERDTQAMSASEQAEADARTMSPSVLDLYRGGEVDSAGNRDFVRAFLGQVVAPSDMGNLIRDDGSMTQDAVRRVQAAMLSRAYGDSDLVGAIMEATESSIKAIGGALTDVAARWAQMRDAAKDGVIAPQMDQTAALLEAVRIVDRARRAGRKVDEFVGQGDMFSGESVSPMGRAFLDMMFRDAPNSYARATGRDSLAETLGRYAAEAMKSQPGADMLGETADPQATAQAVKGSRDGRQDEQQNSLFSAGDAGRGEGAGRPEPKGTGPDVPGQQAAVGSVDPQAGEGRQPEGLNSDTFVRAPDGSNDFGEITADIARAIGRQGGAIRLRAGDDATGLRHIEQRHGEQIRDLGYPSIEAFIAEIARNFGAVYPRAGRALDLVLDADARGLLIVQLEPDASGDFYDVRTATPIRRGQYARKEPLWERAGPSVSPESASSPLDPKGQSGTDNVGANATPDKPAAGLLSTLSAEKQARAAELKAKLAAKARTQVSSGLDPEYITLGGELVALYLEAGTRKFGQMLRDFAETTGLTLREAQAPMRAAYNHVRDDMDLAGQDVSDMDDAAAVMAEVRKAMAEEAAAGTPKQADPEPSAPAPKKVVRPKGDAAGDKAHQPMTGLDALDFDAWDDKTREDGQGSPAKRKGRDITGTWAKTVAKILKDAGWTPALDRKGKALAPVTFGYGMAHEIDETKLSLTTPNGLELFVKIGSPHDMRTKASILVQFTGEPPKKGYSRPFVGPNEWLRDTITPAEAAAQIAEWAERRSNWLRKKAESPVTGAPSGATVIEQGDVPAGGNADADADSVRLVQAGSAEDPGRGNGRGDAPRAGAQGSDRPLAGAPSEDVGDAGTGARAGSRGDRALAPRAQVDDGEPAGGMGPTEAREIADAEWLLMEPESEDQQNPLPLPLREQDALTTF